MASPEMPNYPNENLETAIRGVLNKYVAIWVWSILFGGQTGVLFVLSNYRSYEFKGVIGLFVAPLLAFAGFLSILSYYNLLMFLNKYIIPVFFFDERNMNPERASSFLRRSVYYFIAASAILVALTVVMVAFSSLRF